MSPSPMCPTTVLLVEDHPAHVLIGALVLEQIGYTVETATCGREAVEKVRASSQPFMAILMDVQMDEMDGFEATKIIRNLEQEKGHHNIIIAITAHAMAGDRERCLAAGMDDYISKPIFQDILASKLAALAKTWRKPGENIKHGLSSLILRLHP